MFERLRDLEPEDGDVPILRVLTVNEMAALGLAGYGRANQRVYDEEFYLAKLSEQPDLLIVMGMFCAQSDLTDEEETYFQIGFAMTYTAIANQAEISNRPMDNLEIEMTDIEAVCANIKQKGDGAVYLHDSLHYLSQLNGKLVREWVEYLGAREIPTDETLGTTFISGGVTAHELIRQHINQQTIINTYSSSIN